MHLLTPLPPKKSGNNFHALISQSHSSKNERRLATSLVCVYLMYVECTFYHVLIICCTQVQHVTFYIYNLVTSFARPQSTCSLALPLILWNQLLKLFEITRQIFVSIAAVTLVLGKVENWRVCLFMVSQTHCQREQ
jgi:hypothetical protein